MEEINKKIKKNWDSISKPLDSLGKLESLICKIGSIQGSLHPSLKGAVLVFCADNGIVEEGVSQSPMEVSTICAKNIARGETCLGIIAKDSKLDIIVVDVGLNTEESLPLILDYKIRKGTRNFLKEKAMTKEECLKAIEIGKSLVRKAKEDGYKILCIGEMGIGNTTTSSAICTSLLKLDVEASVGRGAGLSDEGLERKKGVIKEAIEQYKLYEASPMEVLEAVGGYDIASMVGVFLGAKEKSMPIVLDGAISIAAALVAFRMDSSLVGYMIPSHISREPMVKEALRVMNLEPGLDLDMALGEGTGGALMVGVLHTALHIYEKSLSFSSSGVEQYKRF